MKECSTWRERGNSFFTSQRIDFCRMYGSLGAEVWEGGPRLYQVVFLSFPKIFNQSLSEMPTRCLTGCFGTITNLFFFYFFSHHKSLEKKGRWQISMATDGLVCCWPVDKCETTNLCLKYSAAGFLYSTKRLLGKFAAVKSCTNTKEETMLFLHKYGSAQGDIQRDEMYRDMSNRTICELAGCIMTKIKINIVTLICPKQLWCSTPCFDWKEV